MRDDCRVLRLICFAQITHENYATLITQLYDKDDPYLLSDATCAVVNPLIVEFKPRKDDAMAKLDLKYDFVLAPTSQAV